MIISVASLTLRFYKSDGWTLRKVRDLLVCPHFKIHCRKGNKALGISDYFACYTYSGYKIFKASKIKKHIFKDKQHFGRINWYIFNDIKEKNHV